MKCGSTNHRGSSDKSTPTHHTAHTRGGHLPYTFHLSNILSRHTGIGWSGGGGGSGTRGRTDSDGAEQRPPGRPLLCLPERGARRLPAQLKRCQVHREAWRRGEARRRWRRRRRQRHARADGFGRGGAATAWAAAALSASAPSAQRRQRCTGKRGGAGTRGGGGEQASGPRAARRTGDRQAGDGPESDRAQRSGRADRRSAAADLEGVRSATVGVGGRPSCGEEGGRQVRVVRVALHRPVERHSSRDRAWATKAGGGR